MVLIGFLQKEQLLQDHLKIMSNEQYCIMKKRGAKLSIVNNFINIFLESSKNTFKKDLSIDSVLSELLI